MKETIYCNKCGKPMWVDDKTSTAVLDLCSLIYVIREKR